MEDLVERESVCDNEGRKKDIVSMLKIIRHQNPNLDTFKKVSVSSCEFVSRSISEIFKEDLVDSIGSIEEFDKDKSGKFSFKIFKEDFAVVFTSFPFWNKVVFLFYNDEKKIKDQFSDKVFSKVIYEPSIYNLGSYNGNYFLSEIDVIEEEEPILNENITDEIHEDIGVFFSNEDFYRKNKLTYKRGILLYGTPGTGKSSIIKQILLKHPDKIGITINHHIISDSLSGYLSTVTIGRDKIIIIEDIDSVPDYDKSTFLNFLDGVEGLDRTFIIATTNYLSKLDPAICNRPSRFDKTYNFEIPNKDARKKIIKRFFKNLDEDKLKEAIEETDGFSGAYMKEVFIQCGTQKSDILDVIQNIKDRMKNYASYKEPSYV